MGYKRCCRCIMDNVSDDSIRFDSQGYCNYCSDTLQRKNTEYFPNAQGEKILKDKIAKIVQECKNDPYDCLVGVSGGIDSSYILYLGYKFGLRMLAVHVDDGLDNPVAVENLKKLTQKTGTKLITITPDLKAYADLLKSLFKASVSNLAIPQDNMIIAALQKYGEENSIRYSLDGSNFAHECILERGKGSVDACDKKFIFGIQKRFGTESLEDLPFQSLTGRYLKRHFASKLKHFRPLNYIHYDLQNAIKELEDFCGFQYYGGKHYESILTRFMQCYYLPEKFGKDKRKSHFSSLIVSGQLSREEALKKIEEPLYPSKQMLEEDKAFLADYMGISVEELDGYIKLPPKKERDYPHSLLNELAPLARKFRRIID